MHFKVQIEERNLELHSDFFSKGSKRDTRKVFHMRSCDSCTALSIHSERAEAGDVAHDFPRSVNCPQPCHRPFTQPDRRVQRVVEQRDLEVVTVTGQDQRIHAGVADRLPDVHQLLVDDAAQVDTHALRWIQADEENRSYGCQAIH